LGPPDKLTLSKVPPLFLGKSKLIRTTREREDIVPPGWQIFFILLWQLIKATFFVTVFAASALYILDFLVRKGLV